jgi:anti-sigma regulatory factor (Ser/Thr protein kinase)
MDDPLVDDAALLVTEVVSNSVQHAGLGTSDAIEVRIRGSRSMLHVDVIDPGPGFEPDPRPQPEGGPESDVSRDKGGWGLWLVDQLSTRWGVECGEKTRVWFDIAPAVSTASASGT